MFRYLAFVWDESSHQQAECVQGLARQLQSGPASWESVLDSRGLQVFCTGVRAGVHDLYYLDDRRGVVLGTLFEKANDLYDDYIQAGNRSHKPRLGPDATTRILNTDGKDLTSSYWGRYVAFLVDPVSDQKRILREPLGNLPCFFTQYLGVTILFSHMSDCLQLRRLRFTINWKYLSQYVTAGMHYAEGTALNEVAEVHGGECIAILNGDVSRQFYWHPFSVTQRGLIEDGQFAARALRASVKRCTHAWASCHQDIIHQISGGLDSSIVLGCLHDAPSKPNVTCLTYYLPGAASDERPIARIPVRRTGFAHVEYARHSNLDFTELLRLSPSVNPMPFLAFLETNRYEGQLASDRKATAVFNGVGGDYIFCGSSMQFGAADFMWFHGVRPKVLSIASDVALRSDKTIWRVLKEAFRDTYLDAEWEVPKAIFRSRKLVRPDILADIARTNRMAHPWMQEFGDIPYGIRFMMIALSVNAEPYYDPLSAPDTDYPESVSPLLSQPVVELCLRIPSYVHTRGGRDRGLARRAFEPDVPRENLTREWKDRAAGHGHAVLMRNLSFARELLLGGILVEQRLLDGPALERALSASPTRQATYTLDIFSHLATEAWLRTWSESACQAAA